MFRRWGALYILLTAFVLSWGSQWVFQLLVLHETAAHFWQSTFENWQSEFLQLAVQFVLLETFIGWKIAQAKEDSP